LLIAVATVLLIAPQGRLPLTATRRQIGSDRNKKSGLVAHVLGLSRMTQSGYDRLGVCLRSIQKADGFTFRDSNSLSFCMHWS
jgi:hypothetical protein